MGSTVNYQIPYPEQEDAPDGASQMQSLAEQVDLKLKVVDNGMAANTTRITALETNLTTFALAAFTPATGWSLLAGTQGLVVTLGTTKICFVSIIANRTGSAITSTATGQVADTDVATLPTALRPTQLVDALFTTNNFSGALQIAANQASIKLLDMYPSQTFATSSALSATFTYITT